MGSRGTAVALNPVVLLVCAGAIGGWGGVGGGVGGGGGAGRQKWGRAGVEAASVAPGHGWDCFRPCLVPSSSIACPCYSLQSYSGSILWCFARGRNRRIVQVAVYQMHNCRAPCKAAQRRVCYPPHSTVSQRHIQRQSQPAYCTVRVLPSPPVSASILLPSGAQRPNTVLTAHQPPALVNSMTNILTIPSLCPYSGLPRPGSTLQHTAVMITQSP